MDDPTQRAADERLGRERVARYRDALHDLAASLTTLANSITPTRLISDSIELTYQVSDRLLEVADALDELRGGS